MRNPVYGDDAPLLISLATAATAALPAFSLSILITEYERMLLESALFSTVIAGMHTIAMAAARSQWQ